MRSANVFEKSSTLPVTALPFPSFTSVLSGSSVDMDLLVEFFFRKNVLIDFDSRTVLRRCTWHPKTDTRTWLDYCWREEPMSTGLLRMD